MGDAFLYLYLPSAYAAHGLSSFWVGMILSINRFTRLFINMGLAVLFSRMNPATLLWFCLTGSLLSTAVYGFESPIVLWLFMRVLWGLCFSGLRLGSQIYAVEHDKPGVSLGLSRAISESIICVALISGPWMIEYFGRSLTFIGLALAGLPALLMLKRLPKLNPLPYSRSEALISWPDITGVMIFLYAFVAEGLLVVMLVSLFTKYGTYTPVEVFSGAAFCLAFRRLCNIVLAPLGGYVGDSVGFNKVFHVASILMIFGLCLLLTGFALQGVLLAFAAYSVHSSIGVGLRIKDPGTRLNELSGHGTFRDLGAAVGTIIGSWLGEPAKPPVILASCIPVLLFALILHIRYS